jgi:hypothetical protein
MPFSSSGRVALTSVLWQNRTTRANRSEHTVVIVGVTVVRGVGREILLHDLVTQSLTFEISIDACEWQPGVP